MEIPRAAGGCGKLPGVSGIPAEACVVRRGMTLQGFGVRWERSWQRDWGRTARHWRELGEGSVLGRPDYALH